MYGGAKAVKRKFVSRVVFDGARGVVICGSCRGHVLQSANRVSRSDPGKKSNVKSQTGPSPFPPAFIIQAPFYYTGTPALPNVAAVSRKCRRLVVLHFSRLYSVP